jgi:hypothetical protein
MECIVRTRNDGALPVLEILAAEVDQLNSDFLAALRLCERAANDSRLMTLTWIRRASDAWRESLGDGSRWRMTPPTPAHGPTNATGRGLCLCNRYRQVVVLVSTSDPSFTGSL